MDLHQTLAFALSLAFIIAAAKLGGYVSVRVRQPAVLGELLVGLVLGPSLLDMLAWPVFAEHHELALVLEHLAFLGVIFLMFVAGLEVELGALLRAGKPAVWAGVLGVVTPVVLAWLAFKPLGQSSEGALFIGLVMAATSVSISAQTLMELGVLRTPVGLALLGAAVVDDVLVILLLSFFLAVVGGEGSGPAAMLWILVRMIAYFGVFYAAGRLVLPRVARWVERQPISEGVLSLAVVMMLFFAWAAEALGGVAAITGAFLAGLLFGATPWRNKVMHGVHTIAYAWLVPLFFVNIGFQTDVRAALHGGGGLIVAVMVLVAIVSKVLGSGLGGRLGGFTWLDALRLGTGMTSRGEVGLIAASLGMQLNLVTEQVFAGVVLMVLVTTLVTPPALRALYPTGKGKATP